MLVFDSTTGEARPPFRPAPGHGVFQVFVSPDGARLVASECPSFPVDERGGKTKTFLWYTRERTKKFLGEGRSMAVFTPDSRKFFLCLNDDDRHIGCLKLFDSQGTEISEFAVVKEERFRLPKISPDGRLLVVEQGQGPIGRPGILRLWNLAKRQEIMAIPSGGNFPFKQGLSFSPNSKWLAATDYNEEVRVWDIATGKLRLRKSLGKGIWVSRVAFSPHSRLLAVHGEPKENRPDFTDSTDPRDLLQPKVFLFDLAQGPGEPEVMICPQGHAGGLVFSPDGKTLAVGGAGAVHLFDMTAGKPGFGINRKEKGNGHSCEKRGDSSRPGDCRRADRLARWF
jgi:WD40 repeat protein